MKTRSLLTWTLTLMLGALVVVGSLYYNNFYRLYKSITLYNEDVIVDNFLTLPTAFNANLIPASDSPFHFPQTPRALPQTFVFEGREIEVSQFLQDSGATGLLVIHDGSIVHEAYFQGHAENRQHISWSMGKSFVSGLFGIAVAEGSIASIEQAVTDYVPELKGSGYDGVRIKDVLQMSSGVYFNEDYGDFHSDINRFGRTIAFGNSLDEFAASLTREKTPGTYNHYVSIDTQVLGMVLTRAIGSNLSDFIEQKFWQPMGMEYPAYWLKDDFGVELALGGLNVALRDYGKFGWLFLNKGNWFGEQLVPEQWVTDSVTPDAPHLMPGADNPASSSSYGYGFQWWIPLGAEDEFMARGIYGQYIYIDPDARLVVVKNSANHRYNDGSQQWAAKNLAMFKAISDQMNKED